MKAIALIVVLLVLAIGTYVGNRADNVATETTIEDSVGSQMAAPQKTEAPDDGHHADIPL